MKKLIACLLAFSLLTVPAMLQPVQNLSAFAEETSEENPEYVYENFKYHQHEDYVSITGYVEKPVGELVIPAEINGLPVKFIEQGAFEYCENITSLTIPDTLTSFSKPYTFFCSGTQRVSSVRSNSDSNSIKLAAFFNCNGIKEIHVSATHPTFSSEDGVLFNKDKTELIRYPTAKTEESYAIPDGVTKIAAAAFSGCQNLTSIVFPDSITDVEQLAFSDTSWLKEKKEENPLVIVKHILITGNECTGDIVIPDSVTTIAENAFFSSISLNSVTSPENVTRIGKQAFYDCPKLAAVSVSERNSVYTSENGVLFNKENTSLVLYPAADTKTEYKIPSGITTVENNAFLKCKNLVSVTVPNSVTSIGYGAFLGCSALNSVIIENPDCEIYDSKITLSNESTIYGYENSTAQAYAEKYGYRFELLATVPETTEIQSFISGDSDGNGKIDILDVITINKAVLGKESLTENQLKAVDFNGNGKPDSEEALTILKYIVGLIEVLG